MFLFFSLWRVYMHSFMSLKKSQEKICDNSRLTVCHWMNVRASSSKKKLKKSLSLQSFLWAVLVVPATLDHHDIYIVCPANNILVADLQAKAAKRVLQNTVIAIERIIVLFAIVEKEIHTKSISFIFSNHLNHVT